MSHNVPIEKSKPSNSAHAAFAPASSNDVLLNEHDVAQRQGRSVRTLQNQRVQGGGIPYLKLGRTVRYRLSDVIAWEEARRFNNTTEEGQRDA